MTWSFSDWVLERLRLAPDEVRAYCFNLYENKDGYSVDLVGAPIFLPDDNDWACNIIFGDVVSDRQSLPRTLTGMPWESCLEAVVEEVSDLIQSGNASRLKDADAVAVAFVDGGFHVISRQD